MKSFRFDPDSDLIRVEAFVAGRRSPRVILALDTEIVHWFTGPIRPARPLYLR